VITPSGLICMRGCWDKEALRALFFLDTSVRWYDVKGGALHALSKNVKRFAQT